VSFISGTTGAVLSSQAQKDANRKNARSARQQNQANFLLNLSSRGAALPGSVPGLTIPEGIAGREAAFLPYYFDDRERQLAESAGEVFDATGAMLGTPAEQGARAQATVNRFLPILDQAAGTVEGIYDNSITDEELEFAKPVAESRIKLAGARKDAGLEALQETLNSIKAIQARKGFTGDSLGANRLRFDARRKIFGDAAVDLSQAELANAMEARSIRQGGVNRKLSSLNLPTALAQSRLNLEEQPAEQVSTSFNRRLQPFQFFRTGQNNFEVNGLPTVQPNAGVGQILSANTAALGQSALRAYSNGAFQSQPPTAAVGAYGGYSYSSPEQFSSIPSSGSYGSYGGAAAPVVNYGYGSEYDYDYGSAEGF
jgi:hypothetical protein